MMIRMAITRSYLSTIVFEYEKLDATTKSDTASAEDAVTSMGDKVDKDTAAGTEKGAKIASAHVDTVDEMREDGVNHTETPHQDQGFTPTRAIEGIFWHDVNGNGVKEEGDEPIPGVTVRLLDKDGNPVKDADGKEITATTDENGKYHFDVPNTAGDDFQIEFVTEEEFTKQSNKSDANASIADPTTGKITNVKLPSVNDLTENYTLPNQDAGITEYKRTLSGNTWLDPNDNGSKEDGENKMVSGVTVKLLDQEGNPIKYADGTEVTAKTDENGHYEFDLSDLSDDDPNGDYQVVFEYEKLDATTQNKTTSTDEAMTSLGEKVDEDVEAGTKKGAKIEKAHVDTIDQLRAKGENSDDLPNQDQGFTPTRAIEGIFWHDADGDGTKEDGDEVIPNVTVRLLDKDGNPVKDADGNDVTATTKPDGTYHIDVPRNLDNVDDFQIEFVTDKEFTKQSKESDANASIVDPDERKITEVKLKSVKDLTENYTLPNQDAGVTEYKRTLSGKTWFDPDEDGTRKDDDRLVPGVTVKLLDQKGNPIKYANGEEVTAKTKEDGTYEFDLSDLSYDDPDGKYQIVFETPLTATTKGTNSLGDGTDDGAKIAEAHVDTVAEMRAKGVNEADLPNQDQGFIPHTRAIEGIVWHDEDGDGEKESGDEVIPGVTVNLLDKDGNPVLDKGGNPITTTTDENGKYHFDVPTNAGDDFKVQIVPGDGEDFTKLSDDSDGTKSLPDGTGIINVKLPSVETLTEDITVPNKDAGVTEYTRKLSGKTWLDPDKNADREDDDKFVPKVTVKLLDSEGKPILDKDGNPLTTETDEDGYYEFDLTNSKLSHDDPNGDYQIVFETPLKATVLGNDSLGNATEEGATIEKAHVNTIDEMREDGVNHTELPNQDQGFIPVNRAIEGVIWHDVDGDGDKEDEDEAKPGVTVNLLDKDGNPVLDENGDPITTTTDENGKYHFDVPAKAGDDFQVQIVPGEGEDVTKPSDDSSDEGTKSLPNGDRIINVKLSPIETLTEDEVKKHRDAGITEYTRKLSGNTWLDPNNNGSKEDGEDKMVSGVTVKLLDQKGNPIKDADGKELTAVTGADGHYEFDLSNLSYDDPDGKYQVVFEYDDMDATTKSGQASSEDQMTSMGDKVKKSAKKGTEKGAKIANAHVDTVDEMRDKGVNTADLPHQDQGFTPKRAIEGIVWNDVNGDGSKKAGDKVISGVTVKLLDKNGKPVKDADGNEVTATTDKNGKYHIDVPRNVDDVEDFQIQIVTDETFTKQSKTSKGDASLADDDGIISAVKLPATKDLEKDYTLPNQDAGVTKYTRKLSGNTWLDPNNNGDKEKGETSMLSGVTVRLLDSKGNPILDKNGKALTTKTDKNGHYEFDLSDLSYDDPNGDYQVVFEEKRAATKKGDNSLADATPKKDSAFTGSIIKKAHVDTVKQLKAAGKNSAELPNQDSGFRPFERTITGIAWVDNNGNGTKDADDTVLSGVTVRLLDENGKPVLDENGKEITAVTDKNGKYVLNVPESAGDPKADKNTFKVEVLLDGRSATKQSTGSNGDKSLIGADGIIANIDLPSISKMADSGELTANNPNNDAGIKPVKKTVGGIAWKDDGDGIYEPGEKILPNVPVSIYRVDENGRPIAGSEKTTVTDQNGRYSFDLTEGGDYVILFDVDLEKEGLDITKNGTGANGSKIDKNQAIRITVPTDQELLAAGKTEFKDLTLNAGYIDNSNGSSNSSNTNKTNSQTKTTAPKTGDNTPLMTWMLVMMLAALAAGAMLVMRRRRRVR